MPLWMIIIEWLARLILLLLIGLSVWSIAIILDRKKYFKNINEDADFNELENIAKNFAKDKVDSGISRHLHLLQEKMQKGLSILGTLGSTTPFIGLLGTIMGIIVAFGELSQGSAGTNAIMFALAEALILTAVGLFVAIPAVIAFNIFSKKSKAHLISLQTRLNEKLALKD